MKYIVLSVIDLAGAYLIIRQDSDTAHALGFLLVSIGNYIIGGMD